LQKGKKAKKKPPLYLSFSKKKSEKKEKGDDIEQAL